jgi:hypothetical protein
MGDVVWKSFEGDLMQGTPPPCFPFGIEGLGFYALTLRPGLAWHELD